MPKLWAAGVSRGWDYLAIELLGPSLDSLFRQSKQESMDLRSVCCIAMQLVARLQLMHNRGLLHRDIQLGNCVVGLPPNEKTIYMIDFGFSKRYIDPKTKAHIPDSNAKRDFIGNYWFSSVAVHCRGKVPSRRDDLEAVGLMLVHLLTPRGLPWIRNGIPKTEPEHDRLKRIKKAATIEKLCEGLPGVFEDFLRYSRRLTFKEQPDYERWIEGFREVAEDNGFPTSDAFCWPPPVSVAPKAPVSKAPAQNPRDVDLGQLLEKLAQVHLGDRPVLGDRKNVQHAIQQAQTEAYRDKIESKGTIDISSGSDGAVYGRDDKARRLLVLHREVSKAADNAALAHVVEQFVRVLRLNSGRTLTKEAQGFLRSLHKQLSDPSVFEVRKSNSRLQSNGEGSLPEVKGARVEMAGRLKRSVGKARSNKALGDMLDEFTTVTNQGGSRRITNDGYGFLEGLARRLAEIG